MKRILIALGLICTLSATQAQTLKDANESESLTWYGIDYSHAHFLNFGAYLNDEGVKRGLPRWSFDPFGTDDVRNWQKKYKKDNWKVDIASTSKANKEEDYSDQFDTKPFELTEEEVKEIVTAHDIKGDGYGLMYVVESFDNVGVKEANVWAVFFSEKDKTILGMERYTADTYGDWAEAINLTLKKNSRYLAKAK